MFLATTNNPRFLDGRLPRVAATLVEHTEVIIQLLRGKPRVLPDALSGDLDTRQIADTLEDTLVELRQAGEQRLPEGVRDGQGDVG